MSMSLKTKKIIFFAVWLSILLVGPYTVYKNSAIEFVIKDQVLLANFLQRIFGLAAFTLIFYQIILGSFMTSLTEKLGSWIYKLHITQGIFTYLLVFLHPLAYVFINYKIKGVIDPFYVFTEVCIYCRNSLEMFLTLGRGAFWLLTLAVIAAKFRTTPWLRVHWRKFHIVNYAVFFFVVLHSRGVGSDVLTLPFRWLYYGSIVLVLSTILIRIYNYFGLRFPAFSRFLRIHLRKL